MSRRLPLPVVCRYSFLWRLVFPQRELVFPQRELSPLASISRHVFLMRNSLVSMSMAASVYASTGRAPSLKGRTRP
jgi:hypothetical protein